MKQTTEENKHKIAESYIKDLYYETILIAKEIEIISKILKENANFLPIFKYEINSYEAFDLSSLSSQTIKIIEAYFSTIFNYFLCHENCIFALTFISKVKTTDKKESISSLYGILIRSQISFIFAFEQSLISIYFENTQMEINSTTMDGFHNSIKNNKTIEDIIEEAFNRASSYIPAEIIDVISTYKNYKTFFVDEVIKPILKIISLSPIINGFLPNLDKINYSLLEFQSLTNIKHPRGPSPLISGIFELETILAFTEGDYSFLKYNSPQNMNKVIYINDILKLQGTDYLEIFNKRMSKIKKELTHLRFLQFKQLKFSIGTTKESYFDSFLASLEKYNDNIIAHPQYFSQHLIQYYHDLTKNELIYILNFANLNYSKETLLKYNYNKKSSASPYSDLFKQTCYFLSKIISDKNLHFGEIYEILLIIAKELSNVISLKISIPQFVLFCLQDTNLQKYLYCSYLCATFFRSKCKSYHFCPISDEEFISLKTMIDSFYEVLYTFDIFSINSFIQF